MNVYYRWHSSLRDPILSQMNPAHSLAARIFKVHSNILLSAQNKIGKFQFAFMKLGVCVREQEIVVCLIYRLKMWKYFYL